MNKKHFFIMLACCLVPVVALLLVTVFKVPLNAVIIGAMIVVCPLSHFLMMRFMMQEHHESHAKENPVPALNESAHVHHEGS